MIGGILGNGLTLFDPPIELLADVNVISPVDGNTLVYQASTKQWINSSGVIIGSPVTGGTPNSVLFLDASGNLAEDATNFSWDDVTHVLSIGGGAWTLNGDGTLLSTFIQVDNFGDLVLSQGFNGAYLDLQSGGLKNTAYIDIPIAGSMVIQDGFGIVCATLYDSGSGTNYSMDTARGIGGYTGSRAMATDGNGLIAVSSVTSTQLGYLGTTTSDVQTQLNTKVTDPTVLNGDIPCRLSGGLSRIVRNGSATRMFLQQTGNGGGGFVSGGWVSLVGADLPNPSASSLGGIQSLAAVSNKWINTISTSGVPSATQPAFTNISGSVAASQLPNPTASTLGGIESLAAVTSNWINAISTSGVPSATQPAFTDISGTATVAQGGTGSSTALAIPLVIGNDRKTGLTAAQALATYTVGGSDASYMISANVNVTAFAVGTFNIQVAYTDETNTAQTLKLNFSSVTGTIGLAIAATGPFEGIPTHIRCKASTTIIVSSTGTFTSLTYNLEERIQQL